MKAKRTPVIRSAVPNDYLQLAEFGKRLFRDAFEALNHSDNLQIYLSQSFSEQKIHSEITNPLSQFFIATVDSEWVGYAKLHAGESPKCIQDRPAIELARIYSEQHWIGSGIGATLMCHCLEFAKQMGYQSIWAGSWKLNSTANRFYRKFGFEVVGETTFAVGNDIQEDYILSRSLSNFTSSWNRADV